MSKERKQWRVVKVEPSSAPGRFLVEIESDGPVPRLNDQLVIRETREQLKNAVRDEQFLAEEFIFDRIGNERRIAGALRMAIQAHGPISPEWIGSAARRVEIVLRDAYKHRKADLSTQEMSDGEKE
jgi:hypothetical protein